MGKVRFSIIGSGVWTGLATAPFLASVDGRDRDPGRLLGTVLGGLMVGLVGALGSMTLIFALYARAVGLDGGWVTAIGAVALRLRSAATPDLALTFLELLIAAVSTGVFAAAFVAVAALLARHPFRDYLTAAPRLRWRLLSVGLILSAIALCPLVVFDRLLSGQTGTAPLFSVAPGLLDRAGYALSALLLIPAAAGEELFFRGWLLRQLAAFTRRPALLCALTGLAFSAAHLDFTPDGFLTRALMGGSFAYMTLRLGGIELSTAAHAVNNIAIVLFIQPLSVSIASTGQGLSAGSLAEDLVMVAGYIAIAEAVVRIAPLRRWARVKPGEVASPVAA